MNIEKIKKIGHFDEKNRRKALFCLDYCPLIDRLAIGGIDSTLSFWKNISKEPIKTASFIRHDGAILSIKWAPISTLKLLNSLDHPIIASGSDDASILIWKFEE